MRNFTLRFFYIGCLLLSTSLSSQVTFTDMGSDLQTIPGWSYADCAADMNGDHLDDVVRVDAGGIYIDYQQADGSFVPVFYEVNFANVPSWSICAADIDKNGYTDLLFGDGDAVSFVYANDTGTGYTEDAQPEYIFSQRSTFSDIDNDGNLDAFVCHDIDQCRPYRNVDGILSFDISLIGTLDVGGNYAAIWCDYDNDWDSDLYITKCRGGAPPGDPQRINLLYRNDGNGVFTSVGPEANMDDGDQSWATNFEDWDNDGDFDSFTVNHEWANRLMMNNGDGTFTDVIEDSGIDVNDLGAWNCDAGDFDNDGFVDIFSEMSSEMYWNNGDFTFTPGELSFNSGGIGDFNDDGFLDVITNNQMWINNGNGNHYVKFDLEGLLSNIDGIGARIEIYGDWGVQIREVRAGESFDPASSLIAHFGIGEATSITQAIVKWPSGMVTVIDNPGIDMTHIVAEVGCINAPSTITVVGNLVICPGESVDLIAEEGESYEWSNGEETQQITVDSPGVFAVIIWDENECASVSNQVIVSFLEEEEPVISLTGTEIFCEGGEVILTSSIGDNYEWSNGMFGQTVVITESGTYSVSINGACSGTFLESEPVTITVLDAPVPVANDVVIGEPGTAILSATGNNLNWYATETSSEILGSGPTFETAFFTDNISYWVDATTIYGGELESGGKPDNSGGGGLPSTGGDLYFNVIETFTLLSVTVYVPDTGDEGIRTVQLFDSNGTLLLEASFDLGIGTHVLDLNWIIQPGNGYRIGCAEDNLFRNNSGVTYPYPIGSVGSIYDSSFGTQYYYYFYDWQIEKESVECVSERIEVSASVVGMEELEISSLVKLFPNPAHDHLTIAHSLPGEITSLEIRNYLGQLVYNQTTGMSSQMQIPLNNFVPGVYSLVIKSADVTVSKEFMIR